MKALLLGLAIPVPGVSWASDKSDFLGVLKKFGITTLLESSKKPCLCVGGDADHMLGVIIADGVTSFRGACLIPEFDIDGNSDGFMDCVSFGGSYIPIDK